MNKETQNNEMNTANTYQYEYDPEDIYIKSEQDSTIQPCFSQNYQTPFYPQGTSQDVDLIGTDPIILNRETNYDESSFIPPQSQQQASPSQQQQQQQQQYNYNEGYNKQNEYQTTSNAIKDQEQEYQSQCQCYNQGCSNANCSTTYSNSTCGYVSSDYHNISLNESSHSNYQANSLRANINNTSSSQKSNNTRNNYTSNNVPFNAIHHQDSQGRNVSSLYRSSPEHFSENSTLGHTPQHITEYHINNGIDDEDDFNQEEDIEQEGRGNNTNNLIFSGKLRRNITKKKYEPLFDNNQVFIYEEDPLEYKKARKQEIQSRQENEWEMMKRYISKIFKYKLNRRIQNRHSARKVRTIKKTMADNLESNVDILEKENQDLKVEVANLSAQNKRLRDEVEYFRNIFRDKQNHKGQADIRVPTQQSNNICQNNMNDNCTLPYTTVRTGNKTGQNQQLFVLAVISCLLVFSYSTVSSESTQIPHIMAQFETQLKNKNITVSETVQSSLNHLVNENLQYNQFKTIAWTVVILLYLSYAAFTIYSNFKSKFNNHLFNINKYKSN